MDVDSASFRAVMSRFATGVTVATTCQGARRVGITVNAFASVSLEPPLVLICIERSSAVHALFVESGVFAVNVLSSEQEDVSAGFASNSPDRYERFCNVESHPVITGAPVFDTCLAWLDCRVTQVYPGGDHSIFLGLVVALGTGSGLPLLYYRSRYLHPSEQSS
jgi:flavin reductase (DIM6/NTAB) family NADH-FMN oxidoreductase RutF